MRPARIEKTTIEKDGRVWEIRLPDECPICHRLVPFSTGDYSTRVGSNEILDVLTVCPNPRCQRWVIFTFNSLPNGQTVFVGATPSEPRTRDIPTIVDTFSPRFKLIYREAFLAKEYGLAEVCGPGFRKAFEILIKDYAKWKSPDTSRHADIEKKYAAVVVKEYVGDTRIQAVAARALWIGNDETHYLRVWEKQNIDDLIRLIDLTLHWIEIEDGSQQYTEAMQPQR